MMFLPLSSAETPVSFEAELMFATSVAAEADVPSSTAISNLAYVQLGTGGAITLIHRADRLADILALLGEKCGGIQIRPIHPFADEPAKRVLVRAIKTGKAPLALLPPLILHPREGAKHTEETEAILRGEARLDWL